MSDLEFYTQIFLKSWNYIFFSAVIWYFHIKPFLKEKINNRKKEI